MRAGARMRACVGARADTHARGSCMPTVYFALLPLFTLIKGKGISQLATIRGGTG